MLPRRRTKVQLDQGVASCLGLSSRGLVAPELGPQYSPAVRRMGHSRIVPSTNSMPSLQDEYVGQAQRILQSPMGQMLLPIMQQMEQQYGNATAAGFQAPPSGGR